MNTDTTLETEATCRALTRRAVTVYMNTHNLPTKGGRARGEHVILGIGEAMTVLEIVMTPFAFTEAFYGAVGANPMPAPSASGCATWIEQILDTVAEAVIDRCS